MLKRTALHFLVYCLTVIILTIIPIGNGQQHLLMDNYVVNIRLDHFFHSILYFPFVFLAYRALSVKHVALIIIVGMLFCSGMEFLQMLVPYRKFNINDLIANNIGIVLGLAPIILFKSAWKQTI